MRGAPLRGGLLPRRSEGAGVRGGARRGGDSYRPGRTGRRSGDRRGLHRQPDRTPFRTGRADAFARQARALREAGHLEPARIRTAARHRGGTPGGDSGGDALGPRPRFRGDRSEPAPARNGPPGDVPVLPILFTLRQIQGGSRRKCLQPGALQRGADGHRRLLRAPAGATVRAAGPDFRRRGETL